FLPLRSPPFSRLIPRLGPGRLPMRSTHDQPRRPSERWIVRAARGVVGVFPVVGAIAGTGWMLQSYTQSGDLAGYVWLVVLVAPAAFLVLQAALWPRYEPFSLDDAAPLPALSVIIPAYNEGPMVERSIRSVAEADYPAELLEIIV